ncbi:Thiol:disulfide interchange protein TlpA [Roseivivax sp. THAF40]|uniref:TlpA family protein disulfide reductase n=1 Tax=unclassified Roseivivax TaxID=2639302 RepID=UPI0012684B59|nr:MULTISPECIES: TlpA disulfide reductase family protein [unclassified Roseivivax]QFS84638.1 Thiol:disulfide interchange protein TlpA [Roseivivax sp. THAF197b]QFT48465.1 Thiol:disulfide interchange protein TlpA [Roseivivax sp. THAF40]
MIKALGALVYTAALSLAIPAAAEITALADLRDGDMKKLNLHSEAKDVGDADFQTFDGDPMNLSDYAGKWTLVNFWATWCAPCRKEMPQLSELQAELGGDAFEVVTIATGRNPPPAMEAFFAEPDPDRPEISIDNLPLHRDPGSTLARQMAVLGLPITVLINPEGKEVARLTGDANWASDEAKAILRAAIEQTPG